MDGQSQPINYMKYLFQPTNFNPTHKRISDNTLGRLREIPDAVTVRPESSLVNPSDFVSYVKPSATIPISIPKEIPSWRAKAVLAIMGLLPAVEQALIDMEGTQGVVARLAWNNSAPFVRNGPTVTALSQQLGLSSAQVDEMFIQATQIEA